MKALNGFEKWVIHGQVQGVGFRPVTVWIANQLGLQGCIRNVDDGVEIIVCGELQAKEALKAKLLQRFSLSQIAQFPVPTHCLTTEIIASKAFKVLPSPDLSREKRIFELPQDRGICKACLDELNTVSNRRYQYPLISCHSCGPRFAILKKLPFDRPNTSFQAFASCEHCQKEYADMENRRAYSQTISCSHCGPKVSWLKRNTSTSMGSKAIEQASQVLSQGGIIAVKGMTGFHLLVRADNDEGIQKLRKWKQRPTKPFGLLAHDIKTTEYHFIVSKEEAKALSQPARPLVLLKQKESFIENHSAKVCEGLSRCAIMLPATGIQYLLSGLQNGLLVATSGNPPGCPVLSNNEEALNSLSSIADGFLLHDLEILQPQDDSIVEIVAGKVRMLRRARGFSHERFEISTSDTQTQDKIALGAFDKNTVALSQGKYAVISQYLGNLDSLESINRRNEVVERLAHVHGIRRPSSEVIGDAHPDFKEYADFLQDKQQNYHSVMHHHAHVFAVKSENNLEQDFYAFAWDGTGFGENGQIWGAEGFIFRQQTQTLEHDSTMKGIPLIGHTKAIKEPYRIAMALLLETYGENFEDANPDERQWIQHWYEWAGKSLDEKSRASSLSFEHAKKMKNNTITVSSMGRLFDGIAALTQVITQTTYDGEAAMHFQDLASRGNRHLREEHLKYQPPFGVVKENEIFTFNWKPLIKRVVHLQQLKVPKERIALQVHQEIALTFIEYVHNKNFRTLLLSGGCFQNSLLVQCCYHYAEMFNIEIFTSNQLPPNDGAISFGQIVTMCIKDKKKLLCV